MSSLVVLLLAGAALLAVTAATARRPTAPLPDAEGYLARWSHLHGGFDPHGNRWVRGWLRLSYGPARPLAAAGVLPDVLTAWGLWLALVVPVLAQAGGRWPLAAGAVLVLSGWSDTLDGAVAALTGRATRWGYVLDSVVDRLADAAHVLAVWVLGGPGWLAVIAGGVGFLQEYVRARAGNAGMGEVGVVTVGERATRVILAALALVAAGVVPDRAGEAATAGLAALAAVGVVSLVQLLVYVRRRLGAGPAAISDEG